MSFKRRDFLKVAAGTAGLALLGPGRKSAEASATANPNDPEFFGMLIDTTMCVGCRACEQACNDQNKLSEKPAAYWDDKTMDQPRDTQPEAYLVVNKYTDPADPTKTVYSRKQCMHCNQPACTAACLVKALEKTKEGPVIYNKDRCMGCRYCMIACPFDIPKFEYDSPLPYIKKCIFCAERLKNGEKPACAEACPAGATLFGTRRELLEEARKRIYTNPGKYYNKIYGENEVGGTGIMYLSAVPFEKLGMNEKIGSTPYPEDTLGFLFSVPLVDVLWPALLAGLYSINKGKENEKETHHE